jgi:hypothetical protein
MSCATRAIPGFLLKVTPAGRKIFMIAYVAANGQRRKPAIGRFGEITVEQAKSLGLPTDTIFKHLQDYTGMTGGDPKRQSCRPCR